MWEIDLKTRTAKHESGVVVRFTRSIDGTWYDQVVEGIDNIDPSNAATLMQEAWYAFAEALHHMGNNAH